MYNKRSDDDNDAGSIVDHQSHSGPSEKWPRTSRAVANWNIICDSVGCSSNSVDGKGGSQRGRIWRPRKPRCSLNTTSQNTKRKMRVLKKSSPKNWTYDESAINNSIKLCKVIVAALLTYVTLIYFVNATACHQTRCFGYKMIHIRLTTLPVVYGHITNIANITQSSEWGMQEQCKQRAMMLHFSCN